MAPLDVSTPPPAAGPPPKGTIPVRERPGVRQSLAALTWFGAFLTRARTVTANALFLLIGIFLVITLTCGEPSKVPSKAALVLDLNGALVEEQGSDPSAIFMGPLTGGAPGEISVHDVIRSIDYASTDSRIEVLVLELGSFQGGGMSKLQDVGKALARFRDKGKKVIAYGDGYSQSAYYLASHADEIWVHPMGEIMLEGLAVYPTYYKGMLDKLMVDVHVFRVGTYKSAVEPYISTEMSQAAKEANLEWMGDLWRAYETDVAANRQISVSALDAYVQGFDQRIRDAKGDGAKAALDAKLVDKIGYRDEAEAAIVALVGENKDEATMKSGLSYAHVRIKDYVKVAREDFDGKNTATDRIAVVVARGVITDGNAPPGSVGGDSTAALIRQARKTKEVKAIVLRVDSPGGSAFASEVIRRELELARNDGKVVVVSMGSVAASGGYWISTASDEIWAAPTTITGSIGIFGIIPDVSRALNEHLGIRVDGVATSPFAGASIDRPLDPHVAVVIQASIERGYRDFLTRVGNARGMTPEQVDPIAQGRVWSGEDAHRLGLVDQLGGLDDAIASAAKKAGVDKYSVHFIERELDFGERFIKSLLDARVVSVGLSKLGLGDFHLGHEQQRAIQSALRQGLDIARLDDPHHVYAISFLPYD